MMSEITILSIITISIMFILYLFKLCLNSKCDNCEICYGLIRIHRNIKEENDIEKYKIDKNYDDLANLNNINNVMSNLKNNNVIK